MKIKVFPFISQLQRYSQGTQVPFVSGEFVSPSKVDRNFSTSGTKVFLKKEKPVVKTQIIDGKIYTEIEEPVRKRVPIFSVPADKSWKSLQQAVENFFVSVYHKQPILFVESGNRVV